MKKAGIIATAMVALACTGSALAEPTQKVVYHINGDDAKQQSAALRNVMNHINAVGAENIDVKVVMHGDGLSLLLYPEDLEMTRMPAANADDDMQVRVSGLKAHGVEFQVCANTLRGREIPLESLYDVREDDVIDSGVAHLSVLQMQGYTYIKP